MDVRRLTLFAASVLLMFVVSWAGVLELVDRWATQEEYGHGFFIPLIAIWLLWRRRHALLAGIGCPAWTGLLVVLLSAGMVFLGELAALFVLIQVGLLLGLVGVVLAFGGWSLLRVARLPLSFLVFAIPLPYFLDAQLSWRLQLISSEVGVEILRTLGTSVYLEGNIIDFGDFKLQVVEACSGLRYLYPLLSISFLIAYLYRAPLWQRGLLFVSAVPITVFMNSLRIAVVGVLVARWGNDMAQGFLHFFEGWIIFMACLLVLLGQIWAFERLGRRRDVFNTLEVPPVRSIPTLTDARDRADWPLGMVVLAVLATGITLQVVERREEVLPERAPLATFPLALGGWRATEAPLSDQVEKALGVDDYLMADFRGENGIVNLYVGYYASQRKGVSPHSPQVCIPGGGWTISALDRRIVSPAAANPFEVNRVVIDRDNQRQVVYYWFAQRGRRIANEYWMKAHLLQDAVFRNRTDGALVRLTTPLSPGEALDEADKRLSAFLDLSLERLSPHLPE